ncbi:hypothetical protein HOY34_06755 [Xinfangfangia sp. D13-10-4-6]|uniref:hypothetical protein n=1 Tax=Pseudogemmobacter hezensis TaxID=2737662 RepID=UPI00155449D2|nr:hypothetical protein [Pseudogemmobacter hezensis]NPD14907.1 hypothetical protein [Pseudogemmobacter hezensis]
MTGAADPRRMALSLGLAVFLLMAVAGASLSLLTTARLNEAVAPDQAGLIDTASSLVGASLRRGSEHGVPLDRLPGIGAYLEDLRGRLPGVTRIDLTLNGEVFQTGESRSGDRPDERSLNLPGEDARIRFYSTPPQHPLTRPARLARVLGIAALAGLLAASWYQLSAARALQRSERRFERRLAALKVGDFRPGPSLAGGTLPGDYALVALRSRLEPLNLRYNLLQDLAGGLKAIDHDGRLSAQVDQVMAGLPAWTFADKDRTGRG